MISFFPLFAHSQSLWIDSLKNVLPSLKDGARIDCLNELGAEFSDRYWSKSKYQQTDTAYMYTMQALSESEQLHYSRGTGKALQNLGIIAEEHGDFKAALYYTQKSLPILEKENMSAEYHRGRVFLGYCLYQTGSFAESIDISKKEIPYYEAIGDSEHIAMVCRMTGRTYDILGNAQDAFTYYKKNFIIQDDATDVNGKIMSPYYKSLVYLAAGDTVNAILCRRQASTASLNQRVSLASFYLHKAAVFSLQKQYDSALFEIRKSIWHIQSSTTDSLYRKAELMMSYCFFTDAFLSLKNFDSAIIYGQRSIDFYKNAGNIPDLMWALKMVASAYHSKKENANALLYTRQLFNYAQKTGAKRHKRDALRLFWSIYENRHNTVLANSYHLKYALLNDALEKEKYISQGEAWKAITDIKAAELRYQNNLRVNAERNNARIEFINREKSIQFYVFIAAIALVSLVAVLIVRNYRLKRNKEQLQIMMAEAKNSLEKQKREQEVAHLYQQKTELEMQALRAQMNPHFIFNCLSSVNRFILTNKVDEASDYLTKFSRLIRMALQNSERPLITLESELEALRLYLDLERVRFKNAFNYSITFINAIDVNTVYIPPMLIQPFAENAIWHGLMHKKGVGCLEIQLCAADRQLTCAVIDNGIGRSKAANLNSRSAEKNKSMGLDITAGRLALLNVSRNKAAAFTIEDLTDDEGNGCGTKVILTIPYKELTEVEV